MNNPIYRREKVLELKIKEYSQTEIAEELGISQPTVSRYLQAIEERHLTLGERYPDRMSSDNEKMNLGYDLLLKVQWNIVSDPSASTSEKLRACSQIANCYTRKQHMNSNRHNIRLLAQELKNEE